jgi:cell division protein FtsB
MRLIAIFLTVLLLLVQYPLWLGKGGWLRVWDMDQQVHAAHDKIDELKARNAKLASEVHDLKEGTGAVEERARSELGMIKQDEIFVQILDPSVHPADALPPAQLSAAEKAVAVAVPAVKSEKSAP